MPVLQLLWLGAAGIWVPAGSKADYRDSLPHLPISSLLEYRQVRQTILHVRKSHGDKTVKIKERRHIIR